MQVERKMIGGKDALNDPFGVVHEGAHWVWSIIPMGRNPNGYQVQVYGRGFRIIATPFDATPLAFQGHWVPAGPWKGQWLQLRWTAPVVERHGPEGSPYTAALGDA
jgi:hypothetical protein